MIPKDSPLSEHERHAQAAQILRKAQHHLPWMEYLYCEVRWGKRRDWAELRSYIISRCSIDDYRRLGVDQIVRKWRGEGITKRAMQRALRCRAADVDGYRKRVYDVLQEIDDRVLFVLDRVLVDLLY